MTRIAIDGNEANVHQRVGSNTYAYQLLLALEELLRHQPEIRVEILLSQPPVSDWPPARDGWEYRVFGPAPFWTQWALPWYLFHQRSQIDVFFTPGHYAPRVSPVPYISSIMDLAFLFFPEQFRAKDVMQLREWTRYSVAHAARVVVISEATRRDVVTTYGLSPQKTVLAYPSTTNLHTKVAPKAWASFVKRHKIVQPFLLYVGTLQPRKNLIRLIEAFEAVAQSNAPKARQLQLVCAGKIGWLADDVLARAAKSPVKNRIIFLGYVSEAEKAMLYQASLATILVGLYEGFGMPPLEALQQGSVPIVSNTSSLPEVVGDAGILVDPTSVHDIRAAIDQVLSLPAKDRSLLLKAARKQAKKFSWVTSAQVVLQALLEVAAERQRV